MIKSLGVVVSLCLHMLSKRHGPFNEILRILFQNLFSLLKFVMLVPNQTFDEFVMIVLYKNVVHSCLRGVFLFMRG